MSVFFYSEGNFQGIQVQFLATNLIECLNKRNNSQSFVLMHMDCLELRTQAKGFEPQIMKI